jgi:lauroyl/myristoyl acyltransferase
MDPSAAATPGRSYRHRFEGPFFRRLMLGGIRYIPPAIQRLSMPLWGSLFYSLLPTARAAALHNLDRVLGPAPPLARHRRGLALFRNYAQMIADSYALHQGRPLDFDVSSYGRHHLLDAVGRGQGAIAATGHLGMWQVGPFLAEWRGLPQFYMAMAAEPNPLVQKFEDRFRDRFRIIYTTESPFSVLKLAAVLREGAIVGMQLDRHLGGHAIPVPFCGQTAYFPTGPATLARAAGAPLVPSFFVVEPAPAGQRRRLSHYLDSAISVPRTRDRDADVAQATYQLVAAYERLVRRFPTQWYQFYDFFAPPPVDPTRAAARAADAEAAPAPREPTA